MYRSLAMLVFIVGCVPAPDKDTGSCEDLEVPYDGVDNDCDESTPDDDLDGDGFVAEADCNDEDAAIHPDADEVCDPEGVDENCNDLANDADDTLTGAPEWFPDSDGDTFGRDEGRVASCEAPENHVSVGGDCDDAEVLVNPDATEICDGFGWDDDCNGLADENDPGLVGELLTFWVDADDDGYGVPSTDALEACTPPPGYAVAGEEDCGPNREDVNPGMDELCDAGNVDENCDGLTNDGSAVDALTYYQDGDGDGFGVPGASTRSCTPLAGGSTSDQDCDDLDADINPDATERCDSIDWDCDSVAREAGIVTAVSAMGSLPVEVSTTPGVTTSLDLTTTFVQADEIVFCGDSTYYVQIETDRTLRLSGVELRGQKPVLDGSGAHTVIRHSGANGSEDILYVDNMVIQNGYGSSTLGFGPWGVAESGGGISCNGPFGIILLGATYTAVDVTDSVLRDNSAPGVGGGVAAISCDVTFIRSSVENNTATSGGGIYADGTNVGVRSSKFEGNAASGTGYGEGGGAANLLYSQLTCAPAIRSGVPSRFIDNTTANERGSAIVTEYNSTLDGLSCDFGDDTAGTDNPGYDIAGVNDCFADDWFCDGNRDEEGWNLFEYGDSVDFQCEGDSWELVLLLTSQLLGQDPEPSQTGVSCGPVF